MNLCGYFSKRQSTTNGLRPNVDHARYERCPSIATRRSLVLTRRPSPSLCTKESGIGRGRSQPTGTKHVNGGGHGPNGAVRVSIHLRHESDGPCFGLIRYRTNIQYEQHSRPACGSIPLPAGGRHSTFLRGVRERLRALPDTGKELVSQEIAFSR